MTHYSWPFVGVMFLLLLSGCMTTEKAIYAVEDQTSDNSFRLAGDDEDFLVQAWLEPERNQLILEYRTRNGREEEKLRWCEVSLPDVWPAIDGAPSWEDSYRAERLVRYELLPTGWLDQLPAKPLKSADYTEKEDYEDEAAGVVVRWALPAKVARTVTRTLHNPPERSALAIAVSTCTLDYSHQSFSLEDDHMVAHCPPLGGGGTEVVYYSSKSSMREGNPSIIQVYIPQPTTSNVALKYLVLPVTIPLDIVTAPLQIPLRLKEAHH